jgi:hypothetical protein
MMNIFTIIFAGWIANFIYTLYSRVMFSFYHITWGIPETLGYVFIRKFRYNQKISAETERVPIGNVIHYLVGIAFAFAFILLKNSYVSDLTYTLIFGLIHGVIAVIAWFFVLKSIDKLSDFRIRNYLWVIFTGHFVYVLCLMFAFRYGIIWLG